MQTHTVHYTGFYFSDEGQSLLVHLFFFGGYKKHCDFVVVKCYWNTSIQCFLHHFTVLNLQCHGTYFVFNLSLNVSLESELNVMR